MVKYTARDYVRTFPNTIQEGIRKSVANKLRQDGFSGMELREYTENAMNSRLIDLEDTIRISYWLNKANSTPGPKPKRK